jgi:hypothetical protein
MDHRIGRHLFQQALGQVGHVHPQGRALEDLPQVLAHQGLVDIHGTDDLHVRLRQDEARGGQADRAEPVVNDPDLFGFHETPP